MCSPDEGFGFSVCLLDEAIDGVLKLGNGSEHTALEAPPRELGEEAFDGIEPGRRCWREVERPSGMLRKPFSHLRILWVA